MNTSNTGSDNVYFKALEFTHNAIYTLLVGQLASSGMSNGTAQSEVRQDILEADARSIESAVRSAIAAPGWQKHIFWNGYEGCMVVVTNNGKCRTYFLPNVTKIDKSRIGKSYEVIAGVESSTGHSTTQTTSTVAAPGSTDDRNDDITP